MQKTLLLATIFILSSWTADAGEIRLRDRATCTTGVVRLADLAEVNSTDLKLVAELKEIELFPSPAEDRTRIVHRQEVQQLLALTGVSLREFRFTGPESITLRRTSAVVAKAGPVASGKNTATIVNKPNLVNAGAPNPAIQLVVHTTRPLRQGMVVGASDVQLVPATNEQTIGETILALDEIVGKELKRSLSAGQSVPSEIVQSPRLVRRGEAVTIKSFAAGVVITTGGKALEEGGQGDVIPVEIAEIRERVFARVVDFRTVAIYAQTPKFAGAHAESK